MTRLTLSTFADAQVFVIFVNEIIPSLLYDKYLVPPAGLSEINHWYQVYSDNL